MNQYRKEPVLIERIEHPFNIIKSYEKIEWLNYWLDQANAVNHNNGRRILLIGDSTSRAYRSELADLYKNPVDYIGVSSIFLDEFCLREIELFFEFQTEPYELIQIQIGCHGIENMPVEWDKGEFYKCYEKQYKKVIDFLQTRTKKIVLATTTPIVRYNPEQKMILKKIYNKLHLYKSEKIDYDYETDITIRNQIVKSLVKDGIVLNDLYELMLKHKMKHIDHIHYEKRSNRIIAESILKHL